jgi:O-antigen/teichoic acid export membrane protein
MTNNVINSVFNNLYYLVIGKLFNASSLGFYTRAYTLVNYPIQGITNSVQNVTFPSFSLLQDNPEKMVNAYRKAIKFTALIVFPLLIFISFSSRELIIVLITSKWLPSVQYLKILSLAVIFTPLTAINNNCIYVSGKANFVFFLNMVNKLLIVGGLLVGLLWGIIGMIYSLLIINIVSFLLTSIIVGKTSLYKAKRQYADLLPFILLSSTVLIITYFASRYFNSSDLISLILKSTIYFGLYFILLKALKIKELDELTILIKEKII